MKIQQEVAYFAGCAVNFIDPHIGKSVVNVLRRNEVQLLFPDQKCCGIPQLTSGDRASFFEHATLNVRSLHAVDCDIVVTCPTCALALKSYYPKMLESRQANEVAQRTFDIMEYLLKLKKQGALTTDFHPLNIRVMYHAPCHLRATNEDAIVDRLDLLRLIPEVRIKQADKGCCGMGGTFGSKKENYPLSMAIGEKLFEEIRQSSPDIVSTDCPACALQIHQGTGMSASHPITVIERAYGDFGQ